jgi:creatinine amidohydrolase/Fe(II)-dependent formamide hydrolase-like protein/7-cyano-7-deazaguanine synthase in queuosine biosynthesis
VGPVRVDPDRAVCPYRVTQGKKTTDLELVYRYEEAVFTPGSPQCENLVAMITAQVALNYGLFCREIVFRGGYDRHDQRFLQDMAENTAREILVKKFLEPNPFLRGEASRLDPVKQERYLRAALVFEGAETKPPGARAETRGWSTDRNRLCVLSSGGKDSLLSYGMLKESGSEAHCVFVNESGKHWFTALNAYRALKAEDPNTARVWTNSDRVFNAMVRLLPFIRDDFQRVRADEYPIRLWTVAVFLFGALPLLRKRGIGRLVIGNEHDTSVRTAFQGITHYDGLYDQSIYFDQAMSRYFGRKGWGVAQFSVVRPLSELLIEKVLMERYPQLLALQVSCHAAHVQGERIVPCGDCEKCRRIVGMILALGGDPGLLGYGPEPVDRCLKALSKASVHQESAGAEHMYHLLAEARHVEPPPGVVPKANPEILKVRIHPERSPLAAIPKDLRRPLLEILFAHAAGAVRRHGRVWLDFDPLPDPGLDAPYAFEAPERAPSGDGTPGFDREKKAYLLGELTWPEAADTLKKVDVALLPVGSIEQHGLHLPLDTDAFDAFYLCVRVAEECSAPRPIVLPLVSYGVSYHHDSFLGTISISPDTLSRMVYEIGMSIARQGVTKLVIVNGHGGNSPALHFAAQMINRDAHIFTCVDTGESSDTDIEAMSETPNDVHAGEIETSTTLATRPELVDLSKAKRMVPDFSSRYLDFTSLRSVIWYVHTEKISRTGVLGDPTKASAEKGRRMWDVMVKNLVELVEGIKGLSLDEIHQRRY